MADDFNADNMLDMYLYENGQLLEQLEEIVLENKDEEAFDENNINEIFRIMHTIKGSSGVMKYDNIMKTSHKLEDIFYFLRENRNVEEHHMELTEIIFQVLDFINGEMDKIRDGNDPDGENTDVRVKEVAKFTYGQEVRIAGIITSVKKKYTKNNKIMAFVTIEDLYGSAEIIVFEPTYMKSQNILVEENIVMINGRISIREDDATKIVANDIKNFGENKPNMLTINITNLTEGQKAKLRGAIKFFHGEQNNISIMVKINDDLNPCGAI